MHTGQAGDVTYRRTTSSPGHGHRCMPWCASARPSPPSRHSPGLASKAANTARYASPPQRRGWRKTTRMPRRRRSNRSWTAQFPSTGGPGWLRLACWRRSPAARSAARPPLGMPGARTGPGRTRRRTVVVPAAPGAGPAGASCPAAHRPRRPGRRRPQPAGRPGSRPTSEPRPLLEALSGSETQVLRYLPAKLSGAQRASAPGHSTSSKACINGGICAPRIGQYAHLQQCIRLAIRVLMIGARRACKR